MNKFTYATNLAKEVIMNKDNNEKMHELADQLIEYMLGAFPVPTHVFEFNKLGGDMGNQKTYPDVSLYSDVAKEEIEQIRKYLITPAIPNETDQEYLWPIHIVKYLLRDYCLPLDIRKLSHFMTFVNTHGIALLISENSAYIKALNKE